MNQKIVGIIPLMVAMLFVAVFAVGDNQAVAADTATQTATVSVNQVIGLSVTDTTFNSVNPGTNDNPSTDFTLANTGNVKSDVYVQANAQAFSGMDSWISNGIDITAANYRIVGKSGDVAISSTAASEVYDNLATAKTATSTLPSTFTTKQLLNIPSGTEDGNYQISVTYKAVKHGSTGVTTIV